MEDSVGEVLDFVCLLYVSDLAGGGGEGGRGGGGTGCNDADTVVTGPLIGVLATENYCQPFQPCS